jgi:hypothetical protein
MYKKTKEDFQQDLAEQIYFLRKSARDYDNGDFIEAKNMSVNLRNLLYDTKGRTTSVLTHLDKKNIKFYDTSIRDIPENLVPLTGLICYKVHVDPGKPTEVTYKAPFDKGEPQRYVRGKVNFEDWWNREIIDDKKGNVLTRRSLVLTTCQQDGGAHVDAEIIDNYVKALQTFHIVPVSSCGEGIIFSNIIYASIRQITHEVLKSLQDEFPKCFNKNFNKKRKIISQ